MMEKNNAAISEDAIFSITRLLAGIHEGDTHTVMELCTSNILCKYGSQNKEGEYSQNGIREMCRWAYLSPIVKFNRPSCCTQRLGTNTMLFTGYYRAEYMQSEQTRVVYGDYTIVMDSGKAVFIELRQKEKDERYHKIQAVDKSVYHICERKILYLESIRNHLLWHYGDIIIESMATLTHMSGELSADFVRIHRSYIVNKRHVANIKRCNDRHCIVTMANGDTIPIPYQKYVTVREQLLS
jgi:hypothetical protein